METKKKFSLTPEQEKAVTTNEPLIVLRASAGSGKTHVLVERYIRLVLVEGIAPTRILAAAFTEKAAAEMKERVAARFLEQDRPDLVAQLNAAPICTLHGFCSRLITPHTLRLGLDPSFQVSDEYESRLIQEEVITQLLASWRKERPSQYDILVRNLDWSGDSSRRRGRSPASCGFTQYFLDLVETVRCAGWGSNPPFKPLTMDENILRDKVGSALDDLKNVTHNIAEKTRQKVMLFCSNLEKIVKMDHLSDPEILPLLKVITGTSVNVSPKVRDILKRIKYDLSPKLLENYYLPQYNQVQKTLNEFYAQFIVDYRRRKDELGVMDFLDLEEIALLLLHENPDLVPVEKILIDEAQDLNRMQIQLIERLQRNAAAFFVGDRQQSIYRFRHAEVELFEELYRKANSGALELHENFRSRKSVLAVINHVFSNADPAEERKPLKLVAKLDYPQVPHPESDFVELLVASGGDRQQAREREAWLLAARISEIVNGGNFKVHDVRFNQADSTQQFIPRDPTWTDVMILVRASTSFDPLERAFHAAGIPLIVQAGRGFWDSLEISDLLALLCALENPGDDFSFACLLRSPAVGFDDNDLLELRIASSEPYGESGDLRYRSLYDGLQAVADKKAPESSLPHRAAVFLQLFQRLFIEKDLLPARRLIEIWVEQTGLEEYWERVPKGHIQRSNVLKFMRLCDQFAGESLARLRLLFEEIRVREIHESVSPDPCPGGYAVNAMTVHSAKGMEAPIVALFDLNYMHSSSADAFAFISQGEHAGAYFCLRDPAGGVKSYKPMPYENINEWEKEKSAEEEERIFYVAMTRAREKLILSASASRDEETDEVRRPTGWFKFFLERTGLDENAIFDPEKLPEGEIAVLDREGVRPKIGLRRYNDARPPQITARTEAGSSTAEGKAVPTNFPAAASPSAEPVAVVQALRRKIADARTPLHRQDELMLLDDGAISGVSQGIWAHRILQIVDLRAPTSEWEELIVRQAQYLFHQQPDRSEVNEVMRLIGGFMHSLLAQEALRANRILREFPFLFELSGRWFRGKLDLAFQTSGGWTLVDFKSDRNPDALPLERIREYNLQLQTYALAWRAITGDLPAKAALFFLDTAKTAFVSLDAADLKDAEAALQQS